MPAGRPKTSSKGRRSVLLTGMVLFIVLGTTAWFTWDYIRFWWLFESLGKNQQGFPEYRHRQTGIVLVRMPGGTFKMGLAEDSQHFQGMLRHHTKRFLERFLLHEVTLSPFLVAKYEVCQEEWTRVMGSDPSEFSGERLPVDSVTWDECMDYCQRVGLDLPTEAQWEYACRAGTNTESSFGEDVKPEQANFGGFGKTERIDSFSANAFGLHNMHGNVAEWCRDVLDWRFYTRPEATDIDPLCTSGSKYRVFRGGSWQGHIGGMTSYQRWGAESTQRPRTVGFRPVFKLR